MYPRLPDASADSRDVREFLLDLGARKEFRSFSGPGGPARRPGEPAVEIPSLTGLRLHGAQAFVRNYENPDTPYPRLLLNWQTGTGKTIGALSIAQTFARRFALEPPETAPSVFVIGFTRAIVQAELLRHPEFGFVTAAENVEAARLRALASRDAESARHFARHMGNLRRRITDRRLGGRYRFFGYKEFGRRLLTITPQGESKKVTLRALCAPSAPGEPSPLDRVKSAVAAGDAALDSELLGQMERGLVVADEIHNVYNVRAQNNYGAAIQFVLDTVPGLRAVFMSATVASGDAGEVVDLVNLLSPVESLPGGRHLRRADFFTDEGARPGALDRLGRLSAGRVAFLSRSPDDPEYPRRVFEGEALPGLPYLKFDACPMPALLRRTVDAAAAIGGGVSADARALFDFAFPSPDSDKVGLYRSSEIARALIAAPQEWKDRVGLEVEPFRGDTFRPGEPVVVGGRFLAAPGVARYSTKASRLVELVLGGLASGGGKCLVYHPAVRSSGVLLLAELLRANGFAGPDEPASSSTLCVLCGAPRGRARSRHPGRRVAKGPGHAAHDFVPARYAAIHGELDATRASRLMRRFNADSNARGAELHVLIGSRLIREGFDFKAVRRLIVASVPTDISTLIQVLGRAVRRGSHLALPPEERDVRVRILVSTAGPGGGRAPELERYTAKMRKYLVIQRAEQAVRRYAVNGFSAPTAPDASLESLPVKPFVSRDEVRARPEVTSTFYAFGHGHREVDTVAAIVETLTRARRVWTRAELWDAVRSGSVGGVAADPASFSEGSFALALERLLTEGIRASGGAPEGQLLPLLVRRDTSRLVRAGRYLLRVPTEGASGRPVLDVGTYRRGPEPSEPVRRRVGPFVRDHRARLNFRCRLSDFERFFGGSPAARPVTDSLFEFSPAFHRRLLQRAVEQAKAGPGERAARAMYRRLKMLVTADSVPAEARRLVRSRARGPSLVGYVDTHAVRLRGADGWHDAPRAPFGLAPRFVENPTVVGFTEMRGARVQFKLRPPVQDLALADAKDARSTVRGAECTTRPRAELERIAKALGGRPKTADWPNAVAACKWIRGRLLDLETRARQQKKATRYLYLFNDPRPALTGPAAGRGAN